ncbi:CLUMA_CG001108, isoform A [Clunio marinus]|uniref:CLUMA_CG001108, isoform A n=1 Tax=Clunio marinus TaxID=568069 RepID=A0A1J1HIC2_9DIPT|nr:CLUMA_CG001108, isoform A [Clunio marinus]
MLEMPNPPLILDKESSIMDSDLLMSTTMMTTTPTINISMPEDMVFNAGHQLSIIVYSILMFISAFGNITVLVLLIKRRLRSPSRLDIMLTHLAIADLMVTFLLMPLEIGWAITVQWTAGDAMCRIMMFFRTFGLYLSSFILVCISVDRFYAVLRPLSMKEYRGKIMIAIAWILSALCSAPQSVIFHVDTHPIFSNFTQCVSFNVLSTSGEFAYNILCLLMMYAVPLLIIVFSYGSIYYEIFQKSRIKNSDRFRRSSINVLGRAKRRTLRMTITIVIVFIVCWTPYYVMVVWFFMDPEEAKKADILLQKSLYLFACTNSCMNPIVYGVFNLKRNKTDRNTFSFNTHYSDSKRKRTQNSRMENFSRESSKTICINI